MTNELEAPFAGKGKPLDLSALDTIKACNDGAEIELLHPSSKRPLGQFIKIVGKDSDAFTAYADASNDADRNKAFQAQRKNRTPEPKYSAQQKADAVALLVACTVGFRGIVLDGAELTFSPDNATKLYNRLPWVKEQVDAAIVDYENFIKG